MMMVLLNDFAIIQTPDKKEDRQNKENTAEHDEESNYVFIPNSLKIKGFRDTTFDASN